MIKKTLEELINKYATEIDEGNFRKFILDLVKECGAEGINQAKQMIEEENDYPGVWDKEVFKIVQQLLGVKE